MDHFSLHPDFGPFGNFQVTMYKVLGYLPPLVNSSCCFIPLYGKFL